MAIDLGLARTGRAYAWFGAVAFVAGAVIFVLLNLGVGASPASGLAQYSNTTFLVAIGSACLLIGMLALIPVGLALREALGRGAEPDLMFTFLVAGSLLGLTSRLLLIPMRLSLSGLATTKGVQPQALSSFMLTYSVVENATNWLLYGWFLLTGLALYHAARAGMRQAALPRAWSWLGLASAIGCWLVVVLTVANVITDAPATSVVGRLIMAAVGIVLIPTWLAWLGVRLRPDPAAVDVGAEVPGPQSGARPGLGLVRPLRWRPWTRPA
jgi:hypothetical protein